MNGIELITKEREEQLKKHGWDTKHDDEHINGELVDVAVCLMTKNYSKFPKNWDGFYMDKFMGKHGVESLKVAGALIAAEIDRLQRLGNDKQDG